jgi:hypothetical protein
VHVLPSVYGHTQVADAWLALGRPDFYTQCKTVTSMWKEPTGEAAKATVNMPVLGAKV